MLLNNHFTLQKFKNITLPSFKEDTYFVNFSLIASFPFVCKNCFTFSPSSVLSFNVISIYKLQNMHQYNFNIIINFIYTHSLIKKNLHLLR